MNKNYQIFLIVFLLFCLSEKLYGQIVYIPDANFKLALFSQPGLDKNLDYEIQVSEAQAFTGGILVSNKNISDLTGIEAFVNIKGLSCNGNQLTSLNVTFNTSLTYLNCDNNQLTSLNVTSNTSLTYLSCDYNQLTSLNVTSNTSLTYLSCDNNQLTSLNILANTVLYELNCQNNQLTALDVSKNTALFRLNCELNQLSSLNLSNNTTLFSLNCSFNHLKSLNLVNNNALDELHCRKNQLTSLSNLANKPALRYVNCSSNQLTSLNFTNDTGLDYLDCSGNQLTSLNLLNNSALSELQCSGNELAALNLTTNTALEVLHCGGNLFTTLNLENNSVLTNLNCSGNQLTALNLENNSALTTLYCLYNKFTDLIIKDDAPLRFLDCSHNNLTSLNVNNTTLQGLVCSYSQLASLNIENTPALQNLECDHNKLVSLNVSAPLLTNLRCDFNELTALNLANMPALRLLICDKNKLKYLDASVSKDLWYLGCNNNQLSSLDLRTGYKWKIEVFDVTDNPNLTCVSVDDPNYSKLNWDGLALDPQTQLSDSCSCQSFSIKLDTISDASCTGIAYAKASAYGANGPFHFEWLNAPLGFGSILQADTTGIYTLKVTDTNFCENFLKIKLNVPTSKTNFDLNTNLIAEDFRPGRVTKLNLFAQNAGCVDQSAQLKLVFSGPVKLDTSEIPPTNISGHTLEWDLGNLTFNQNDFLNAIHFQVDTTAQSGDIVCFELSITPLTGDANATNNLKLYCFEVVNSYDPNDKQVYPQGLCTEHYTLNTQPLTYTIRFQNTGNAPAIDVYLIDSLSPFLNIETFQVLQVSHTGLKTQILGDQVLKFDFKDINLADSLSDEEGSKGFVTYRIDPYPGLVEGTVIKNSAGIYFDFNPPVITNETYNTMVGILPKVETYAIYETWEPNYVFDGEIINEAGLYTFRYKNQKGCDSLVYVHLKSNASPEIVLYPNPTDGQFYISLHDYYEQVILKITDLTGREVKYENINSTDLINLSINEPDGIYFVAIKVDDWEEQVIKLIKR